MGELWSDIQTAYDLHIQASGKELHFLVLIAFLCSFAFIRTSAHMIRAAGVVVAGQRPDQERHPRPSPGLGDPAAAVVGLPRHRHHAGVPVVEFVAIAFGIGMGLTLDEFALWLNLEDVYWPAKGRQSIDAVVVTVSCW